MTAVAVPITQIELAVVARLKAGLGKMVTSVDTYGGEFDDDLSKVIRRFPGAWVTFGGVSKTRPTDTSKKKWLAEGLFVVMVGCRSVRSEAAGRHGGPALSEVGTNMLVYAVRRLLMQQDLGLEIEEFAPGAVKTLFNTRTNEGAFSVYALEFHTSWLEYALPKGSLGQPESTDQDQLFADYRAAITAAPPDFEGVNLNYHLAPGTPDDEPVARDHLTLGEKDAGKGN